MSRGIRMNVFANKAMLNKAKKELSEHAKNSKSHKQELIQKYQQQAKHLSSKPATSKKKQDNNEIQKLRQQVRKMHQQQQKLSAEKAKIKQQATKQIRKLKHDNRNLRQQIHDNQQKLDDQQIQNDKAATKLMGEYIEIASWLRLFEDLDIDPFNGKTVQYQLQDQYQQMMSSQIIMFKILQLAWSKAASLKDRARQYNHVHRQLDLANKQLVKLQAAYQHQADKARADKRKLHQALQDAQIENERLRNRYVNGTKLDNAFHIMFDQLSAQTVQQYGQLAPLIKQVMATFSKITIKKDSPFIYGYYYQRDLKSYIGDKDGNHLQSIRMDGISTQKIIDLKDGTAIKVQRVDKDHYYLVNTMPWVNQLFQYLTDNGAFQPNKLVPTTGTVKLSKLLSDKPAASSPKERSQPRVIMGEIVSLTNTKITTQIRVMKYVSPKSVKIVSADKVEIINPDKIAWLYSKNVLLVGNKKVNPMVIQLRKYVNLSVMDAYEDSLELIFTKMQAADYVFILLGSVPHALTDYLKHHQELGQKVEYFYRANANEGVRRLNYLYMNRDML
ncbi:hypothetical protein H5S09_03365 [Limosilactobacillus sp. STM2_1]|uniref:Uncharacterized protein n=1 Tax=Limosilactobacillus rudii TaxID=2759755 RepID=A0A7W3YN68_9LACO|nr:hypothetical protein [Limosilactobacillus rudii]MBB1079133.1 hypothetical protein [Limosilactobacillus rudii]MBB1096992.1 hypothetical protein [Limosilactobacillus rudii]MCD7133960.1 hypothetical protein [Limosilactobacillus rudii]